MIPKKLENLLDKVEKPGRYIGGEYGEVVKSPVGRTRVAFCFPDSYEIGMSNLGMKILYGVLNEMEEVWCERCFAPWPDMGELLKARDIPLYALESGDSLGVFDFLAFTLQYEMCYTNVLYMLDLAGIPFRTADRGEEYPILLCGGPCTYNPEPFADFFDIMSIGEGEEALPELMRLYRSCREKGMTKSEFLREASHLEGFYVPSLYEVTYNADGTIADFAPKYPDVPKTVRKRIVSDFEHSFYPTRQVVPSIESVHDRTILEINRGCIHGCRFCQAGMICRPVRERSAGRLNELARDTIKNTGFSEISMCSLSISDYTELPEMCDRLLSWCKSDNINLSLPSMRIDTFAKQLTERISSMKRGSLTFAPEAGTQALRDRINKGVTEENLMESLSWAFSSGRTAVKLYFMSGLPTETDEDIVGIAELSGRAVDLYYKTEHQKGHSVSVNISVSCFVPKPFTPFQWEGQNSFDELTRKQELLRENIHSKKIRYSWHEAKCSRMEAVMARGDRRLSKALENAYALGQKFDSWDEFFNYENWEKAVSDAGLSSDFYANRLIPLDEKLPWDFIDIGVSKEFLKNENRKAHEGLLTPDCESRCSACGVNKAFAECGAKFCPKKIVDN